MRFRRRRDADAWARLEEVRARVAVSHGIRLLYVVSVYQRARRGAKAIVETDDGRRWDAWFWHHRPQPGSAVAAAVSLGWGPHNERDVLYVGWEDRAGVFDVLDRRTIALPSPLPAPAAGRCRSAPDARRMTPGRRWVRDAYGTCRQRRAGKERSRWLVR